mgnify:CR=1 FL=1
MKTKVVVLDWDGVLYDSAEIYARHFNTVFSMYGKEPLSLDDFRKRTKFRTGIVRMRDFARNGMFGFKVSAGLERVPIFRAFD